MIARHESTGNKTDLWAQLAAPLPTGVISWRQDGRPIQREGRYFARFVAYIDANTVRERLDSVVPGEWDLTLELLPTLAGDDQDESRCSFKARLQILGVIREDAAGSQYLSPKSQCCASTGSGSQHCSPREHAACSALPSHCSPEPRHPQAAQHSTVKLDEGSFHGLCE